MMTIFGSEYAGAYNALYGDKDYATECDMLEAIFRRYGAGQVSRVLDLGCGTGNHAIPLGDRGYRVVGVDRSPSMLSVARARLTSITSAAPAVTFQEADARSVELGQRFDAVVMMFAVLGYQVENQDVLYTLETARRHLRPGGLLIFDVWYGPTVLQEKPAQRIKIIETEEGKTLRVASGQLDTLQHTCSVSYRLWRLKGGRLEGDVAETHTIRFFFPQELGILLGCCGLELVRLGAFPDFEKDPDDASWNVIGVARVPPDRRVGK